MTPPPVSAWSRSDRGRSEGGHRGCRRGARGWDEADHAGETHQCPL